MTSIKNIDEFENFTIVKDVVFVPKKSKGYWVKLIFNNSSVHINSALCGSVECESDFERFKNLLDQLRSNKRVYLNIASYSREKHSINMKNQKLNIGARLFLREN